jgi:tRNA (guanine-N7-)-methyltransferase
MPAPDRTIKSWVSRIGSLSPLQKTVLLRDEGTKFFKIKNYEVFKNKIQAQPQERIFLDIGFGDGQSFIQLAQEFPDALVLGFEPHLCGVAQALVQIERLKLTNAFIFQGDVLDYLEDVSHKKASRVHLYFSDPWPKLRHHKRRLVQKEFLRVLSERLIPGSLIHIATDWADYAQHIRDCFHEQDCFKLIDPECIPKKDQFHRRTTKYEQRGITLGHAISEFYALLAE